MDERFKELTERLLVIDPKKPYDTFSRSEFFELHNLIMDYVTETENKINLCSDI